MSARLAPANHNLLNEKELRRLLATPYVDMGKVFPTRTLEFLRRERKRALKVLPVDELISRDVERHTSISKQRELERLYKEACKRIDFLKEELDLFKSAPEVSPVTYKVEGKPEKHEATACALYSDTHPAELVEPEQVNGLNEYNLKIFEYRSQCFFVNLVKLLVKESKGVTINNLILWLGGDIINGNIHEDLAESNQLGPMDEVELSQDTIAGGIELLLKSTPSTLKITVVCSVGNHGRTTKKQRIATEHENALEWLMYGSLSKYFRNEPRINFIRNRSYHTYVDVHGYLLRFHHGHQGGKYQGGVGGMAIPVNKSINDWNKGRAAYLDCFGHYHNLSFGPNFIANGSMVGYNPYAISIHAPFQKPQQAFFLIDSRYGLTVRCPILLEET